MTELRRLLESSPTPATRALLRSGVSDRPRREAKERAALALGLAAGVAATTSAASATAASAAVGAAATSAAAGSANAVGTSLGGLSLVKWLAIGMTAGVVSAGGAAVVRHEVARGRVPRPSATSAAGFAAPAPENAQKSAEKRGNGAVAPTRAPAPPSSAGTVRSAVSDPAPRRPPPTPNPIPSQASRAIAREVAQIDAARVALASGDTARAFAELDRYERTRETPTFVREAELLRIEAFSARGERGRAAELARRYLKRFPSDAHVAKLREQFDPAGRANP